jgi:hypothetical protein
MQLPRLLLVGATLLATVGFLLITPGSATHGGTHTATDILVGPGSLLTVIGDDSLSSDDTVRAVAISPDGSTIVAIGDRFDLIGASNDLLVVAWDSTDIEAGPIWTDVIDGPDVSFDDSARDLVFAPDGAALYVTFAQERIVANLLTVQFAVVAFDPDDGTTLWGPLNYPNAGPGSPRDMPYTICVQPDGLQVYAAGNATSSLAIAVRGNIYAHDPAVNHGVIDAGGARMYVVAIDTTDGSENWRSDYISDGSSVDNAATLATSYPPGYMECSCNDDFVAFAGTDVNAGDKTGAADGANRNPGTMVLRSTGVPTTDGDPFYPDQFNGNTVFGNFQAALDIAADWDASPFPLLWVVCGDPANGNGIMMLNDVDGTSGAGFNSFNVGNFLRLADTHYTAVDFTDTKVYNIFSRRPLTADPQTSRRLAFRQSGREDFVIAFTNASGGVDATKPDFILAGQIAPAVSPLEGSRGYALLSETVPFPSASNSDGVEALDSNIFTIVAEIPVGSPGDVPFNNGSITGRNKFDGPDTPSTENLRRAYDNLIADSTFTRADWEHDFPSRGLLAINSQFTLSVCTSQQIVVGVTESGSSRFTVIQYEPDAPVPPSVTITDPSGAELVGTLLNPTDDTTTAYVGTNADVLVALGDAALGFDPVQTFEEAVYIGRDGVRELLLSGGPGADDYIGTWRSSRINLAPPAIPAGCAASEGVHTLDGQAEDANGITGFGSVAITVSNKLFSDVDCLHFAFLFINACKRSGISAGFPAGDYKPSNLVNRGQMAVFTARVASYNTTGDQTNFTAFVPPTPICAPGGSIGGETFTDVLCDHFAYKHVEYIVSLGIAAGTSPTTFGPALLLRRNAMAVFMAKSKDIADNEGTLAGFVPPICGSESFPDVGCAALFYKEIEYIKAHLITSGFGDGTYRPTALVDRAAMSVMLIRCTGDEDDSLPFPVVAF